MHLVPIRQLQLLDGRDVGLDAPQDDTWMVALVEGAGTETTNAIAVMLNSDFVLMPDYRVNLIDQLDLTRSPGFIDPRSQRPISPENDEPAFTGNGLNPISFGNAFGSFRSKIHID